MSYQILLYYLYTRISDPEQYAKEHYDFCNKNSLFGRVLVASEGVNGTLSGTVENCKKYMEKMQSDPLSKDVVFKIDEAEDHAFSRLSVKVRDEIVTLDLGEDDFSPLETTGNYLEPPEWKKMMEKEDVVILDTRNDYETEMGHFKEAICPEVNSFKELPDWVSRHREELEGKKILAYCTGGVRCEKFTGYLIRQGFEDVYQLHGGIVNYGKHPETRGHGFDGKCYVFDERVGVDVNFTEGAKILSKCQFCQKPSARQINCSWHTCNGRYFCCEECEVTHKYCSALCEEAEALSLAAV